MRDSDFGVASGDKLDELAQALEKGDHGHVEPAILEQARDGEIARTVPEWVEGGGIGGDDELRGKRVGKVQVHQHTTFSPLPQLVKVPLTLTKRPATSIWRGRRAQSRAHSQFIHGDDTFAVRSALSQPATTTDSSPGPTHTRRRRRSSHATRTPSETRRRRRCVRVRWHQGRILFEFLDRAKTPTGDESVPPKVVEAKLVRDSREEEERVTPGGVDLGPFDLRERVAESASAESRGSQGGWGEERKRMRTLMPGRRPSRSPLIVPNPASCPIQNASSAQFTEKVNTSSVPS